MKPVNPDIVTDWVHIRSIFIDVGCKQTDCSFLKIGGRITNCNDCVVHRKGVNKYSKLVRILHETS